MDQRFLTVTVGRGSFRPSGKTPLSDLVDEFVVDTPPSRTASFHAVRFVYFCVGALVLQFSAVAAYLPALAPALFVFATIHLIGIIRHGNPVQQTRILNNWGREIVAIPHLTNDEVRRRRFEEQLGDAIVRAKALPFEDQLRVAVERATAVSPE